MKGTSPRHLLLRRSRLILEEVPTNWHGCMTNFKQRQNCPEVKLDGEVPLIVFESHSSPAELLALLATYFKY